MIWLMDFLYLTKRTASDKVLRDKAFNIAKTPIYDQGQRDLASMVSKVFDKKSSGHGIRSMPNQQHGYELHKPIIKKKLKAKSIFII